MHQYLQKQEEEEEEVQESGRSLKLLKIASRATSQRPRLVSVKTNRQCAAVSEKHALRSEVLVEEDHRRISLYLGLPIQEEVVEMAQTQVLLTRPARQAPARPARLDLF